MINVEHVTPRIQPELPTVARLTIEADEYMTSLLLDTLFTAGGTVALAPPIPTGDGACTVLLGMDYGRYIEDRKAVLN